MAKSALRVRMSRQEVRETLRRLPAALAGAWTGDELARGVRRRVGEAALGVVKEAFEAKAAGGTDESGLSWEPLKAGTRKGRPILRDTGRLLGSLTAEVTESGEVAVGTDLGYARYHHEGTETIPARPLWPEPSRWPASWWRRIGEEARAGLLDAIKQALRGG